MAEDVAMAENEEPDAAPDINFAVAWRGYDRGQVNEYILALTERARRESEALREAERELAGLRQRSTPDSARRDDERAPDDRHRSDVGVVIERIVTVARQEAGALVADAEREAADIRAVAERSRSRAESEAASIVVDAKREAERILADARTVVDKATLDAAGVDAEVDRRVQETLREHGSVLEGVARVRDAMDRLTPILENVVPGARQPETDRPNGESVDHRTEVGATAD